MAGKGKQVTKKPADGPPGTRRTAQKKSLRRPEHTSSRTKAKKTASTQKMLASLNNLFTNEAGQPLSVTLQQQLGGHFDQPLDHIRVHSSAKAKLAAMTLGARAFTLGSNIAFEGPVNPSTADGYGTLIHEVAHALQQRHAQPTSMPVVDPSRAHERQAQQGIHTHNLLAQQAVQRQVAGVGEAPTVRFAQLSANTYQIIAGGVRLGSLRVEGVNSSGSEWFGPAHIVQSDSAGHRINIGLIHTPGVTVSFHPRSEADVLPLLESRHLFYPDVEDITVPAGTTPAQFGARMMESAQALSHPPVTEMTMVAPDVRVESSEIYVSRPREAREETEPEQTTESSTDEAWGFGTMLLHTIMGEWEEDPYISSILLDTSILRWVGCENFLPPTGKNGFNWVVICGCVTWMR
jgi:Domain of unknown function (DUF4157)